MEPERFNEEDKSNEKADICEFCVAALLLLNKRKKIESSDSLGATAKDLINFCLNIEAKKKVQASATSFRILRATVTSIIKSEIKDLSIKIKEQNKYLIIIFFFKLFFIFYFYCLL